MIATSRHWWRRVAVVCTAVSLPLVAVAACSDSDDESAPPGTVGVVAPPQTLETLLPLVTDSSIEVADTGSVAPGTMFGGNVCTALSDDELRSAAAMVPPSGTDAVEVGGDEPAPDVTAADPSVSVLDSGPVGTVAVSADACRFVVRDPVRYSVLVRVRSIFDYTSPDLDDPSGGTLVEDEVSGIAEGAIGIDRGTTYEVVVKAAEGFFSVSAPDRDTAIRLARAAAEACCA